MHENHRTPLPPVCRYTFDPGKNRALRLVDAWLRDQIPAYATQAVAPYSATLLTPSNTVAQIHSNGWIFFIDDSGGMVAKKGDAIVSVTEGQEVPNIGRFSLADVTYIETLLVAILRDADY